MPIEGGSRGAKRASRVAEAGVQSWQRGSQGVPHDVAGGNVQPATVAVALSIQDLHLQRRAFCGPGHVEGGHHQSRIQEALVAVVPCLYDRPSRDVRHLRCPSDNLKAAFIAPSGSICHFVLCTSTNPLGVRFNLCTSPLVLLITFLKLMGILNPLAGPALAPAFVQHKALQKGSNHCGG